MGTKNKNRDKDVNALEMHRMQRKQAKRLRSVGVHAKDKNPNQCKRQKSEDKQTTTNRKESETIRTWQIEMKRAKTMQKGGNDGETSKQTKEKKEKKKQLKKVKNSNFKANDGEACEK